MVLTYRNVLQARRITAGETPSTQNRHLACIEEPCYISVPERVWIAESEDSKEEQIFHKSEFSTVYCSLLL